MFSYYLMKPWVAILNRLPLKVIDAIGIFLGTVIWHLSSGRRHVAIINARIIGVKNPKDIAKKSFQNTFKAYLQLFYAKRINKDFIDKYVTSEGAEHLIAIMEQKKNYILVGAHFGFWGMLPNIASKLFGFKLITIGRASRNKGMDKILEELRTSENIKYITHRGAIAQLGKFMDEGFVPGVYLDHTATPKDCVNVELFGYKAPTIAGIPAFSARKRCPVIMFFGIFEKDRYKMKIYPPIYPDETLKPKERIEKLARDINKTYEDIFSKYPEQWYLIHRRFKRVEESDGSLSDRVYRQRRHD